MYYELMRQLCDTVLNDSESVSLYNWMYEDGVLMEGLLAAEALTKEKRILPFIEKYVDTFVDTNGHIQKVESRPHSADCLNNGKIIHDLNKRLPRQRYRAALEYLFDYIKRHPRLDGTDAFAHKAVYRNQMWLDGLYMMEPLYVRLISFFEEPGLYSHAAAQFGYICRFTYDEASGLFYHAYDHSREMFWCDKKTGHSPCFWGRAMGWLGMAAVDTFELLPKECHNERLIISDMASKLADGICRYQNENHIWYQITDQGGRKGNYEESSSSCMFAYFLIKGVKLGILDKKYKAAAEKAMSGIIKQFLYEDDNNRLHIKNVCQVAGLGPAKKPHRDGSFSYYISEPIVNDDNKARGPLLLLLTLFAEEEVYSNQSAGESLFPSSSSSNMFSGTGRQ